MGSLELAFLARGGAGERSFDVSKEFALDQVFRDRRAVHLNKSFILAQALCMDGMCHHLFARSRLSIDQNAPVRRSHQRDLLAQRFHGNAVADDDALGLELLFQVDVLALQSLRLNCILDDDQRPFNAERLLEEVIGAEFRGAHRGLDRAVAGDHDHFGRTLQLADFCQRLHPINARQPYVEQEHIEGGLPQEVEAGFAAVSRRGGVAFVTKNTGERIANASFVVDDEDAMHVWR